MLTDDSNGEVVVGARERRQKIGGGLILGIKATGGAARMLGEPGARH
jgi:hypothetical protein